MAGKEGHPEGAKSANGCFENPRWLGSRLSDTLRYVPEKQDFSRVSYTMKCYIVSICRHPL